MPQSSVVENVRTALSGRLWARRDEIEQVVLTRVEGLAAPETADPEYVEGLRAAVSAAVVYALTAVELGDERAPPPPPILLSQARLAARSGIGLDTVLRRYFAGHALVGDYLVEEAEREGISGAALKGLLRTQAALFDRLLADVSEEYAREASNRMGGSEERVRAERVERLLAGEPIDTSELSYDFEGYHLGIVAAGQGVASALDELARSLDFRPLFVHRDESTLWAWLGSRREPTLERDRLASAAWPVGAVLAIGEPGRGLAGWRLTHRQARAALPIALRGSETLVQYADVALLACVLQDDLLAMSLRGLYLAPLERDRDGGETARKTLRAYFAASCNVSSAAARLGVNRHTVTSRLRAIEGRLGRPIDACASELEVALRLHELGDSISSAAR
jgi:PucR-like helix-turn-helix protein/diguanylate cyclase with GGDEF domain